MKAKAAVSTVEKKIDLGGADRNWGEKGEDCFCPQTGKEKGSFDILEKREGATTYGGEGETNMPKKPRNPPVPEKSSTWGTMSKEVGN